VRRFGAARGAPADRDDAGAVTAEIALGLPSLVLVLAAVLATLAAVTTQGRCLDAARTAARAIARGDDPAAARDRARAALPRATVDIASAGGDGSFVRVVVSAPLPAPSVVRILLAGRSVTGAATADAETDTDSAPIPTTPIPKAPSPTAPIPKATAAPP
jgi:Flp pilus assembly protein TadG